MAPSVKVTTASGAAVSGVTVTFAVASGGGSVAGATPVTGSDGIAALGSWTLGPTAGSNTLTASIAGTGVTGNPATFTANGQFASFNPTANTSLSGTKTYASLNIPAGVTVTATGALVINVTGNASIAGTLTGDCMSIEVRVTGNLTVDGLVRNTCTVLPADPPGLKLLADGDLIIGTTVSNQDAIVSDGSIRLTDTATENLTINPLVMFPSASDLSVAGAGDLSRLLFPSGPAHVARNNRPIRAGRGKDNTETKDGPIEVGAPREAGNGADAPAKTQAGACDNSLAIGGTGGRIQLVARNNTLTFKAGVTVKAGNGGKGGSCTSPSGCPSTAVAGKGGNGGSILIGASNIVFEANVKLIRGNGGAGGDAEADADDGPAACANGCDATATGGLGGDAGGIGFAVLQPGTITGTPSEEGADGGTGGLADATGGDGKDCNVCPAGKGGDGGDATATGGRGGNGATGNIWPIAPATHLKGNGGNSLAVAGNGGKGAVCCQPQPQPGGKGGDGGTATSTGGQIGAAGLGGNGNRGVDAGFGGDGGAGGEEGGAGGALGPGIGDPEDILDGDPGPPGGLCPAQIVFVSILPLNPFIAQGGVGSFTVGFLRFNFIGNVLIVIKDQGGTTRGGTTVPGPTETSGNVNFTVPTNEPTGSRNWVVEASGSGVPTIMQNYPINVTPAQAPGHSMALTPSSGGNVNRGSTGSVRATATRTGGFNGDLNVQLRDGDDRVFATGTIPGASSFFDINYTVPFDEHLGNQTWNVRSSGTGIPDVMTPFPVMVNQLPQPTDVLFGLPSSFQAGVIPPGTYMAPILDAVTMVQVGTYDLIGNGSPLFFQPTRIGWGDNATWTFVFGTAKVNGGFFDVGEFEYCFNPNSNITPANPIVYKELRDDGFIHQTVNINSTTPDCLNRVHPIQVYKSELGGGTAGGNTPDTKQNAHRKAKKKNPPKSKYSRP
ncbi:MAG: hypothetical protein ACT4PM_12040 [Gemmatimonadales bacterium]